MTDITTKQWSKYSGGQNQKPNYMVDGDLCVQVYVRNMSSLFNHNFLKYKKKSNWGHSFKYNLIIYLLGE